MKARDPHERVDVGQRHPHEGAHEGAPRIRVAERIERQRVERDARLGHEPTLEPAATTDEQQPQVGIARAQRLGDREEGAQVTSRPAADQEHAARAPACGGRGPRAGQGSPRPRVQR